MEQQTNKRKTDVVNSGTRSVKKVVEKVLVVSIMG